MEELFKVFMADPLTAFAFVGFLAGLWGIKFSIGIVRARFKKMDDLEFAVEDLREQLERCHADCKQFMIQRDRFYELAMEQATSIATLTERLSPLIVAKEEA